VLIAECLFLASRRLIPVSWFRDTAHVEIPDPVPQNQEWPPYRELSTPVLQENPVWNLVDVLFIACFAIVSQFIVLGIAVSIAHSMAVFHGKTDLANNALVLVPAQTIAYLLLIAFMVQIVKLKYRTEFLKALNWNAPVFTSALVAIVAGFGCAFLSGTIETLFSRWVPKSLPMDELFSGRSSGFALAFFGIFVAPLVEELFFRGFLYPALARVTGTVISVVLTSVAFALIHSPQLAHAWVPLTAILLFSFCLTIVRARTKSVATAVLMHAGYNATLFIMTFIATQGFRHMERA